MCREASDVSIVSADEYVEEAVFVPEVVEIVSPDEDLVFACSVGPAPSRCPGVILEECLD